MSNQPSEGKPFSRTRAYAGLIHTSGQVGIDAGGGVPDDFDGQVRVALANLRGTLEEAGASLETVLKTTVFLVDAADTEAMNRLYREFFPEPRPARSTIVTGLVRPELRFEIEAVAHVAE